MFWLPVMSSSAPASIQNKDITEILGELAQEINESCIYNLSFLWEGAKRTLSRKSFSPVNKVSVKFTNDTGVSGGAVDLDGPIREFVTLVLQYLNDSQLFCGRDNCKFSSFQSKCLGDEDYYSAGVITAMSIVHGGPGPKLYSSAFILHFFAFCLHFWVYLTLHFALILQIWRFAYIFCVYLTSRFPYTFCFSPTFAFCLQWKS